MALNRNEVGLQFSISVDLGNSVRQLQSFQEQIRQTASRIQSDMAAASATIRTTTQQTTTTVKKSITDLTGSFQNLGNVLTVGVTAPLAALAAASIKSAVDLDRTRARLIALTGSTEEANRVIGRLRELVAQTPGLTTAFAQESFAQLKALGTIGEDSILRLTGALGRLNAVFSLQDPSQFIRNIQQIFSQGFERADIKEALGQVPIFEQLLEQAFGTKDAAKLRALKDAGKLTAGTYFQGIVEAIETDQRFANATDSIAVRFEKIKDRIQTALVPLGEQLLQRLIPVIEKVVGIATDLLDRFNALSPATQDLIIKAGLLAAALGPTIGLSAQLVIAFKSLLDIVAFAQGGGLVKAFSTLATNIGAFAAANPVTAAALAGLAAIGALLLILQGRMEDLNAETETFLRKQRELGSNQFVDVTGKPQVDPRRLTDEQAAALRAPGGLTSGMTLNLMDLGKTADAKRQASVRDQLAGAVAGVTPAEKKAAAGRLVDFQSLVRQIIEEENRQSLRILEAQTGQRLALLKQRYDEEAISLREFGAEKLRIEMEQANRELTALGGEGDRLTRDLATTKSAEKRLQIEREIARVTGEQAVKMIEIERLLQERSTRESLPLFQLDPAQVEEAIARVDPLLQDFRDRQAARAELLGRLDVDAINKRTEIIKIENQLDLGLISRSDAQEQINALLKQERDLRIAALQVQIQSGQLSAEELARTQQQIEQLRVQGETVKTSGFMDGLAAMSASVGNLTTMALEAFGSMAQGMGQLVETFAMTGQIGAQAFQKLAQSVVAGLAKQAAVKAIYELAEGFAALAMAVVDPRMAAKAAGHFKAAAVFGAVSGAAVGVSRAIAPGGATESGGTGGRFVTGGAGRPETISLIQGQQGNRREPQVVIIRAETEPGVIIRKVADSYKDNGEMRQLIRQDLLQGTI